MAKKSFRDALKIEDSPAAAFLTQPATTEPKEEPAIDLPNSHGSWKHRDIYHVGDEAKSKRASLLIKPSTYKAAKIAADREGLSFNSLVNRLIEEYLDQEGQR